MEASSPESAQQKRENKPPHGNTRPGGAGGNLGETDSANWDNPSEFSIGGSDPLTPARLWVQANPTAAVAGAFATGLLLGILQK